MTPVLLIFLAILQCICVIPLYHMGIKKKSFCVSEKLELNWSGHQSGVSAESRNCEEDQDKTHQPVLRAPGKAAAHFQNFSSVPQLHPQGDPSILSWGRELRWE